jgi:coniferyl-aldehyde dehydrogenase
MSATLQPLSESQDSSTEQRRLNQLFSQQQETFARVPMPSFEARRQHLLTLRTLLLKHKDAIAAAINTDFTARSPTETLIAEVIPCVEQIGYVLKRLRRWMRPSRRHVGLQFQPASARVVYQPMGVVGIMVPFNYPVNLAIEPLIAALAAGNRALIKMSEFTPRTAAVLADMLREGFPENHVAVITGEADVAKAFSELPFDHLLFTGSIPVGRHVMRAAANNLTPVTLELGGKSPAIIADDIPLADIIERLVFAKSFNAGQTCVAPDYLLVPRGKMGALLDAYVDTFRRLYPTLNGNPDVTSIINERHYQRLHSWLKDAEEKGAVIRKVSDETITDGSFRMATHLVTEVTEEMTLMQEELFGPILPVIPYDLMEQALDYVRQRPRPLALYLFTYDKALQEEVMARTHAGSMAINEALLQVGIDDLPFGGVGPSGMGHYHAHEGFLTMSKAKSVLIKGRLNSMKFMYPPYGRGIQAWLFKWLLR